MYERLLRKARRQYYEVATEAYLLALGMCGITGKKAREMADEAIYTEWVDGVFDDVDFVTRYRFRTETERKAQRLAESLEAPEKRMEQIDRAMRDWSRQVGQFAINVTDYAVEQAFEDAGTETVEWVSQKDGKVCAECHALDGKRFRLADVPPKPHWGCRCRLVPAK